MRRQVRHTGKGVDHRSARASRSKLDGSCSSRVVVRVACMLRRDVVFVLCDGASRLAGNADAEIAQWLQGQIEAASTLLSSVRERGSAQWATVGPGEHGTARAGLCVVQAVMGGRRQLDSRADECASPAPGLTTESWTSARALAAMPAASRCASLWPPSPGRRRQAAARSVERWLEMYLRYIEWHGDEKRGHVSVRTLSEHDEDKSAW